MCSQLSDSDRRSPLTPVLILGAGVNGISVARELVLNRVPVWIVDTGDVAFGATAKSSRLIHGGLRYLEYGDFRLVAESLHERDRLLRLAPQFVTPLKLHIPIRRRLGGMLAAGLRFLGLSRTALGRWIGSTGRGLWTVRIGLSFYDRLARSSMVPRHQVDDSSQGGLPFPIDRFPWACSYFDARMDCPERFCVALLREIEQVAAEQGTEFRLLTYHRAVVDGHKIVVDPVVSSLQSGERPVSGNGVPPEQSTLSIQPSAIINATGAWGDWTLRSLPTSVPQLFGGTKGSHLFTAHPQLLEILGHEAVYAEAVDGRLVFLIPMSSGVMIGTTDERFDDRPERAQASDQEIDYLVELTNELFPQVGLSRADVYATCSGVRPLPYSGASRTAAISRDHQIDQRELLGIPLLTLIGGKLTTCRALGEQTADRILTHLAIPRTESTRDRLIRGAEGHPPAKDLEREFHQLALETGYPQATCRTVWRLVGTESKDYLAESGSPLVFGTSLPRATVLRIIKTEWVNSLEDLVERRLLLALEPVLGRSTIEELGEIWQQSGLRTTALTLRAEIEKTIERLVQYYGRRID